MILYIENLNNTHTRKLLDLINLFGKVKGYKSNTRKSVVSLHAGPKSRPAAGKRGRYCEGRFGPISISASVTRRKVNDAVFLKDDDRSPPPRDTHTHTLDHS